MSAETKDAPTPAETPAKTAKSKPTKKTGPARERATAKRPAATGEPAGHSEQGAPAPGKPGKPKAKASPAKQDHQVPSAKEVANNAANIAHAEATGLIKKGKPKADKTPKAPKPKRLSALDAAAIVLSKAGKPMKAAEMIEAMQSQGLWSSPGGKTPEATLYAAIIREIGAKKHESRFKKHDRGLFVATGVEV